MIAMATATATTKYAFATTTSKGSIVMWTLRVPPTAVTMASATKGLATARMALLERLATSACASITATSVEGATRTPAFARVMDHSLARAVNYVSNMSVSVSVCRVVFVVVSVCVRMCARARVSVSVCWLCICNALC